MKDQSGSSSSSPAVEAAWIGGVVHSTISKTLHRVSPSVCLINGGIKLWWSGSNKFNFTLREESRDTVEVVEFTLNFSHTVTADG